MRVVVLTRHDLGVTCCDTLERAGHEIAGIGLHGHGKRVPERAVRQETWPIISDWDHLLEIKPELVLCADFGSLVPPKVVDTLLCVNVHFALLPRYRGRHGMLWALINGEREVGFSIHRIDANVDTGAIYHQERTRIQESDTLTTVSQRLVRRLQQVLPQVLHEIASGALPPRPQDNRGALFVARRCFRDNYIDWDWDVQTIHNLVRAVAPPYSPGAFTFHKGQKLFILEADVVDSPPYIEIPGHLVARYPGEGVWVKTGDGVLCVKKVVWQDEEKPAWQVFRTVGARLGIDWLEVAAKVGAIEWP